MIFTNNSTPLNADNLNKGNWRDDNCLSFTKRQSGGEFSDANMPGVGNRIRIYTDAAGDTWLAAPGKAAFEIGEGIASAVALATLQVEDNGDLHCANLMNSGKCPLKYEQGTGELYLVTY